MNEMQLLIDIIVEIGNDADELMRTDKRIDEWRCELNSQDMIHNPTQAVRSYQREILRPQPQSTLTNQILIVGIMCDDGSSQAHGKRGFRISGFRAQRANRWHVHRKQDLVTNVEHQGVLSDTFVT